MPPSAMTCQYSPVSSMCWERAAATSAMAVAWGTPTPSTPRVVQAAPGPTPTRTPAPPGRLSGAAGAPRRAGAHEVQAGGVGRAAAQHGGDRLLADELLEVQDVPL